MARIPDARIHRGRARRRRARPEPARAAARCALAGRGGFGIDEPLRDALRLATPASRRWARDASDIGIAINESFASLRAGGRSQFLTWEAELSTGLPLGPGAVLLELAGSYVTGVAPGRFAYEETLRVVVDPPWVWRARAGYLWEYRSIHVGPVLEVVGVPRPTRSARAGATHFCSALATAGQRIDARQGGAESQIATALPLPRSGPPAAYPKPAGVWRRCLPWVEREDRWVLPRG